MKSIAIIINTLFITVVSANKISCSKDTASAGSSLQNARKSLKKCKRSCPLSMIPSKREKCLSNLSKVSDKMKEVNEQVIAMSDDCAGVSFVLFYVCMLFVLLLCTDMSHTFIIVGRISILMFYQRSRVRKTNTINSI